MTKQISYNRLRRVLAQDFKGTATDIKACKICYRLKTGDSISIRNTRQLQAALQIASRESLGSNIIKIYLEPNNGPQCDDKSRPPLSPSLQADTSTLMALPPQRRQQTTSPHTPGPKASPQRPQQITTLRHVQGSNAPTIRPLASPSLPTDSSTRVASSQGTAENRITRRSAIESTHNLTVFLPVPSNRHSCSGSTISAGETSLIARRSSVECINCPVPPVSESRATPSPISLAAAQLRQSRGNTSSSPLASDETAKLRQLGDRHVVAERDFRLTANHQQQPQQHSDGGDANMNEMIDPEAIKCVQQQQNKTAATINGAKPVVKGDLGFQ